MFKVNKKIVAGLAAGAAVVAGSGVAFAYWTSSGSVDGDSSTTNPATSANNFYVAQVVASIKSVTKAAGAVDGTCDASDYTLTGATMTVGSDLAPGESANFSGATLAFNDKSDASQDQCKGATVTITYTAS